MLVCLTFTFHLYPFWERENRPENPEDRGRLILEGNSERKEKKNYRRKMNNSDHTLFIESDEEDEEKELHKDEENDSDYSDASDEIHPRNKPNSYNTQWPQSYRQSIDLYSTVPSPSIGFLGTPSLTRLGSSFFSSSLTRRHTPETLSTETTEPLLIKGEDEQLPQHRRSSHYLPPPIPSRRSSYLKKDDKSTKASYEHHPISRDSTFAQTVLNGINVLCGVGMLSTPYAAKEGGWVGLSILVLFGVLSFYTGILLRHCLDSQPELETYPDIGQAAFGKLGRIAISIILYVELYGCCIEYVILESDNLSSLFPNAHISLGGFELNSNVLFAIATTLAVLPTCWLRDLTILSYISAGGVIASILISVCLLWIGLVDDIGFNNKGTTLNLSTFPVAIGLYGYCYAGHSIFPNIYSSMAKPNQFSVVLLTCFSICTALYAGIAVMGYKMFGQSIQSQFTLNLPQNLVATKIAVWTTVVNPFTKYALTMTPVALSLEELIPSNQITSRIYSIIIRTLLVISTLLVGLAIPFFGLVMSLIGSLLSMLITLIVPCACYLSILRKKATRVQVVFCLIIIVVGVIAAVIGSYSAIKKIIESL